MVASARESLSASKAAKVREKRAEIYFKNAKQYLNLLTPYELKFPEPFDFYAESHPLNRAKNQLRLAAYLDHAEAKKELLKLISKKYPESKYPAPEVDPELEKKIGNEFQQLEIYPAKLEDKISSFTKTFFAPSRNIDFRRPLKLALEEKTSNLDYRTNLNIALKEFQRAIDHHNPDAIQFHCELLAYLKEQANRQAKPSPNSSFSPFHLYKRKPEPRPIYNKYAIAFREFNVTDIPGEFVLDFLHAHRIKKFLQPKNPYDLSGSGI